MKRLILLVGMTAACLMALAPERAQAHGWRWRSGCSSYYNNYSYCSPQFYYPTYNNCSPYYSNYGSYYGNSYAPYSNYGSYYGNGYAPYSNYGSSPYGLSPQYNNFGPGYGGVGGGGSLLGIMGANTMAGANLSGSLLQPSYLSMPVGVGYGQSGYLQVPVGNPAGRASYLQIPVNTGYGPSSYLQIELGRNPGSAVPATQTPGPTPNPLGSAPSVNIPTASRFAYGIHTTPSDELPPVVPALERKAANVFAAVKTEAPPATPSAPATVNQRAAGSLTTGNVKFLLVSGPKVPLATQVSSQATAARLTKNTSFSLVDADIEAPTLVETDREQSSADEMAIMSGRESTPWVAK